MDAPVVLNPDDASNTPAVNDPTDPVTRDGIVPTSVIATHDRPMTANPSLTVNSPALPTNRRPAPPAATTIAAATAICPASVHSRYTTPISAAVSIAAPVASATANTTKARRRRVTRFASGQQAAGSTQTPAMPGWGLRAARSPSRKQLLQGGDR